MKIAFYQQNENLLNGRPLLGIEDGNPGIGGGEYETLIISYLLSKRDNGIDCTLITASPDNAYPHKNVGIVKDLDGAFTYCVENGIHVLVINYHLYDVSLTAKYRGKVDLIIWAHCRLQIHSYRQMYHDPGFKRIVCVGREQMDLYRDELAATKTTYIYNYFPIKSKEWYLSKIQQEDNHNVVYMGSFMRWKGFHYLAKAWKSVLEEVPDAQLYVIGGGNLYFSKAKLGPYGIADEAYEREFMPYLTDENGKILPSVHFLGVLGNEKYDVLGKCKVGVPNPCGLDETFCITGIEMQLLGCNVTTIQESAYFETIYSQSSLYKYIKQLPDFVIKRLLEKRDDYNSVYNFISTKFNDEAILKRWEELVLNIDKPFKHPEPSEIHYMNKPLKDKLLKMKQRFPILEKLPPLLYFYKFYYFYIQRILKM